MPSFDIVSRTDLQEVDNAVQGAMREISTRYDFKGSNCLIERSDETLTIKGAKLKVQVAIQGDELRVSGKKRDVLQDAIELVKELKITHPLQYVNFRD